MKNLIVCTLLMFSPIVAMAQNETHTPDVVVDSEIKNEAEWKYYISANVGAIVSEVEIKDDEFLDFGAVTNLEFGAKYNHWRVALAWQNRAEVSELFQTLAGHTVSIGNSALRVNGYYDFISGEHFTMYIGAGLGGNRYDYTINEQYNNYINQTDLIQRIFPEISPDKRELLISGICGECFDDMMYDDEDLMCDEELSV